MEYHFNGYTINSQMMEGIRRYIEKGLPPGGFLTAIITNDLRGAVEHADYFNINHIPAFVAYFVNEAPGPCYGSKAIMKTWTDKLRGSKNGCNVK